MLVITKALNFLLVGSTTRRVVSFTRSSQLEPKRAHTMGSSSVSSNVMDASSNPFLDQAGLPKFSKLEPQYLLPAIDIQIDQMRTEFKNLEKSLVSSSKDEACKDYDSIVPALERLQFPLSYTWGVAGHLNAVKNGDELRQAYERAQSMVVKAFSELSQSRVLFDSLTHLKESSMENSQDFREQQRHRAVEKSLKEMKLGGVGLDGEKKERFNQIKIRLTEISTKFSNNVLDSTKAFSLTIYDAQKIGVPSSAKNIWAQAYVAKNAITTSEVDPDKGPWLVTLDAPSYIAAMQHIGDRAIREQLYRAYLTRASDMEQIQETDTSRNNVPLIQEILTLRLEAAKLLGFQNHAEQSLASKMATSVNAVKELADLIAAKALPMAYAELDTITSYARENGGEEYSVESMPNGLMPWDITFWSERYKENKFSLKEEDLLPYFSFEAVLSGLFSLVERIFGIEVKPADGDADVWNKDVRFFHIYDKEGNREQPIASFYLDPYSRPADKRGGAWMDVCINKSEACGRNVPVAYLTCNGRNPVGDVPSLMSFNEVTTLAHELGHGLQHMLTKATVGDVAGINGVEWDAVELPSQFMENWCYHKPTVYGFAKHYKTNEPLPEEMFNKLKLQKTFNAGMMTMRQIYFGQMDMELHSSYDPENDKGETIFDVQRRVAKMYSPHLLPMEWDRFLCSFSHIFAGGYSAGYYSYIWAEVMSADAFCAFEDVGLEKEDEVQKVGRSFRDTVLSLGGGVHPSDVYRRFRGRDPTPEALLRHKGLS